MNRREFITLLGGAAAAWPLGARAAAGPGGVGYVWIGGPGDDENIAGLRQGLEERDT